MDNLSNIVIPSPKSLGTFTSVPLLEGKGRRVMIPICNSIMDMRKVIVVLHTINSLTPDDELIVNICSPGGDVVSGVQIAVAISNCKAKVVRTHALGIMAGSIAAIIWTAGRIRTCSKSTSIMYHGASMMAGGKAADIAESASQNNEYIFKLIQMAVNQGLVTQDEYNSIVCDRKNVYIPGHVMQERLKGV